MKKYEKILIVLLLGSIWGALELYGRDLLRAAGIPQKSALLFGLGIIILYVSKRLVEFPGSIMVMAIIAGLFKTASTSFYPCQIAAVMINGLVFDIAYSVFKVGLNSSPIIRAIAAPFIAYASYALFAIAATFVLREPSWASQGWAGVREYLLTGAVSASLISIFTLNLGYYIGNAIRPSPFRRISKLRTVLFRVICLFLVAGIWIAGQIVVIS